MAKTRLAKVLLTPRGVWSPTVEYESLDLVNYLGSSYIARRDNIGVTPVEGDDWSLSAEKGGKGDQGRWDGTWWNSTIKWMGQCRVQR